MNDLSDKDAASRPRRVSEEGLARIRDALRSLPRDHFIEMSEPSIVVGRSIPPTNAVSEILKHADVQPEHHVLQVGTGAGYRIPPPSALPSVRMSGMIPNFSNAKRLPARPNR